MNIGLREHRSASLRIAIAEGLPEDMRGSVREILSLHSGNPGKGHAKALMYTVCTEADNYWYTLLIQVKPFDDGLSQDQLERFYSKFNFVKVQDDPVLMARSPQKPMISLVH